MSHLFLPGEVVLERYRIEALLDSGAMGMVYTARQLSVDRLVAVKALHPRRMWDEKATERFKREAATLARLQHPNIVYLFDFDLDQRTGAPVLISELVPGKSLLGILRSEKRLSVKRTARLLAQIADALGYAHRAGVVHRDLKPANLMVTAHGDSTDETIKVLDFGLAKLASEDRDALKLTAPGSFVGSLGFASPEQVLGDPADARSDLYSLGCLMFACLCGRAPFVSDDELVVAKLQRGPLPPIPPDDVEGTPIPAELEALLRSLLEWNPKNRPSEAGAIAVSLAKLALAAGDETKIITEIATDPMRMMIADPTTIVDPPRPKPQATRPRTIPTIAIVLSVLLILAAIALVWRSRESKPMQTVVAPAVVVPKLEPQIIAQPLARTATVAVESQAVEPIIRKAKPPAPAKREPRDQEKKKAYPIW